MPAADLAERTFDESGQQNTDRRSDDQQFDMDLRESARNWRRTHDKSHNRRYPEKQNGGENQLKRTVPR